MAQALQGVPADQTWRMEQFGRAYVQAVAAVAGCTVTKPEVDIDSIDLTFARKTTQGPVRSPRLDAQLKTTYSATVGDDSVSYPLLVKNYEELRHTDVAVPRILIVVLVPPEPKDWTSQTEEEFVLRRCGYWLSLMGKPATSNVATVTVRVPRQQVLDPDGLDAILQRIGIGGAP